MGAKTILLATDLSCRSDRAMDRAARLASEWRAGLQVVHALQDQELTKDLPSWRRPPDPRAVALEQVLGDLRETGGLAIEAIVERGEPAALILDQAGKGRCDLIVTGVAREEAFNRFFLGSTVAKLVRGSEVPVLVVKSRVHGPYRKIVVATDFSEGSRQALETALALLPDAEVSLFHAFDLTYGSLIDDKEAVVAEAGRHARSEGRAFLAATPALAGGGRSIGIACEHGPAASLLREYIHVHKIDLVVVGTEGRRGLAKVLLGSTAERILDAAPVDVLVVRRSRA